MHCKFTLKEFHAYLLMKKIAKNYFSLISSWIFMNLLDKYLVRYRKKLRSQHNIILHLILKYSTFINAQQIYFLLKKHQNNKTCQNYGIQRKYTFVWWENKCKSKSRQDDDRGTGFQAHVFYLIWHFKIQQQKIIDTLENCCWSASFPVWVSWQTSPLFGASCPKISSSSSNEPLVSLRQFSSRRTCARFLATNRATSRIKISSLQFSANRRYVTAFSIDNFLRKM